MNSTDLQNAQTVRARVVGMQAMLTDLAAVDDPDARAAVALLAQVRERLNSLIGRNT